MLFPVGELKSYGVSPNYAYKTNPPPINVSFLLHGTSGGISSTLVSLKQTNSLNNKNTACLHDSPALMFHPQVLAGEGSEAGDIDTLILGDAVLDKVTEHGGLTPLSAIEARGQWQVLPLQPNVIQTPWMERQP